MKKVSVIIPNYNNARFLGRCLDSVLFQNYPKKEIIIIDDGSDDDSMVIIDKYVEEHVNSDIIVVSQSNLNASVARNKGIDLATGDYVVFLDSDDILIDGALKKMVDGIEQSKTDIVIGSYDTIDENGAKINENSFTDNQQILNVKHSFERLININPVPTNKLYNLRTIKDNGLTWGNVRIGQDLNFYIKYLLLCDKALLIDEPFYQYRVVANSVSRRFDFRIFDIVDSFSDIKRFYKEHNNARMYEKYIPVLALRHYDIQMSKQIFYQKRSVRDLIVRFFAVSEKELCYSSCDINSVSFRKLMLKFRLKCFFRVLFISRLYRGLKIKKRKRRDV